MYLAASSKCFPELPFEAALSKLVDLEYSRVEIPFYESGGGIKPSGVVEDAERAIAFCRQTQRLTPLHMTYKSLPREANITASLQQFVL